MKNTFDFSARDYRSKQINLDPATYFSGYGFEVLPIFPFLRGKLWDEYALSLVLSDNPTALRVTESNVSLDARTGRITVFVNKENRITEIEKEVTIWLPEGCSNGHDFALRLSSSD